jgi:hypothetical protein
MAWPRKIYCAMHNIGVYYTDNFVDPAIQPIWATVNTGLGSLDCVEFHLDPFDQANIQYVLTNEPKLYRREYGGAWIGILDTDDVTALLGGLHYNTAISSFYPDPVIDGRLWAVVHDDNVGAGFFIRSDDRGDNWYLTNSPAMGTYYGLGVIRSYDNYLVYSGLWGVTNRIYLSDDTGASWTDIANFATPSQAIALHPPLNAFYFTKGSGPKQFCEYVFGIGWTDIQDLIVLRFDGMLFDPLDDLHQRAIYNNKLYVTTDDWANMSDSGTITGNPISFADWGGAAPLDIDQMLVVMGVSLGTSQYHHCGVLEGEGDTTVVGISGANCNIFPYVDSIPDDVGEVCISGLAPLRESQGVIYTNAVAMPGYSDTGDERGVPMPGDRGDWDAKNYPLRHANDIDLVTGIHHTLGTDPGQASPGNHTHALDDLSDVTAPAPSDLDVLTWDAGTGQWVNATGGAGMGNAITDPVFQVEGALIVTPDVNGVYICPRAGLILYVYIYCRDPGSAGSTKVDVHLNGVTIFTTQANRPTLAWNDADQVARSGVPDIAAVAENDVLSIDIDQIATGAKDLTVVVSMDIGIVASGDHDHSGAIGSGGQFDADHLLSTGASDGDVLTSDGLGNSDWEAPAGGAIALDDLTDVNAPVPNDDDVLMWDDVAGEWISAPAPGGADANAIHVNQANEISGIANKAIPDNADLIVLEDSAAGFIKKSMQIGDLTGGMIFTDANAIHTNVDSEISAIAPKAVPVAADMIVIEDSADGNNKKMVEIGDLPAPSPVNPGPDSSIPGCAFWFDANQITGLSDADPVGVWLDVTNQRNLVTNQAVSPVYKTNIINSLPVVRFAGTSSLAGDFHGLGGAFTFFMCMKFSSIANAYTCLWRMKWDTDTNGLFVKSNGKSAMYWAGGNYDGSGAVTYDNTNWNIITLTHNANAQMYTRRNKTADKTATFGYTGYTHSVIGYDSVYGGRLLSGDIAEIIAYSRPLTSTERDAIEEYLNTKYNLGL